MSKCAKDLFTLINAVGSISEFYVVGVVETLKGLTVLQGLLGNSLDVLYLPEQGIAPGGPELSSERTRHDDVVY